MYKNLETYYELCGNYQKQKLKLFNIHLYRVVNYYKNNK